MSGCKVLIIIFSTHQEEAKNDWPICDAMAFEALQISVGQSLWFFFADRSWHRFFQYLWREDSFPDGQPRNNIIQITTAKAAKLTTHTDRLQGFLCN